MKIDLLRIVKTLFEWLAILFRDVYAIKENGEIIGFVGMDGSFIADKKTGKAMIILPLIASSFRIELA